MTLIHPDSLAATVDAVSEAAFLGRPMPKAQREGAARFIAGRQGLPGSYAGMFAPSEKERRAGLRLFTGELVRSRAATGHILGEEACRALLVLDVPLASARKAAWATAASLTRSASTAAARARCRYGGTFWRAAWTAARCGWR